MLMILILCTVISVTILVYVDDMDHGLSRGFSMFLLVVIIVLMSGSSGYLIGAGAGAGESTRTTGVK